MRRPGCPQRMATLHGFGRSGGFGCTEHRARTSVGEGEMALIDRYRRGSERTAFGRSSLSLAIAGIIAGLGSAQAQEPIQPVMEEVTVTGTRTRQVTGFTTPVPVTSLSTEELFSYEPGSTIAAQLDALPQFFGNESVQQQTLTNIASTGTASLDLRDLGPNRTLVLFDGYRIVPSSKFGSVNVDAFPTALIRSVEVVTGGASAAYGADAVGGVVNFIIDREYEGFDLRASSGANDFGDGDHWNFSIAGGEGFFDDRLHVVASFEAQEIDGFTRTAREVRVLKRRVRLGSAVQGLASAGRLSGRQGGAHERLRQPLPGRPRVPGDGRRSPSRYRRNRLPGAALQPDARAARELAGGAGPHFEPLRTRGNAARGAARQSAALADRSRSDGRGLRAFQRARRRKHYDRGDEVRHGRSEDRHRSRRAAVRRDSSRRHVPRRMGKRSAQLRGGTHMA